MHLWILQVWCQNCDCLGLGAHVKSGNDIAIGLPGLASPWQGQAVSSVRLEPGMPGADACKYQANSWQTADNGERPEFNVNVKPPPAAASHSPLTTALNPIKVRKSNKQN